MSQQPSSMPVHKYRQYQPIGLTDRTWPDRMAQHAPLWCSVDLRDGNQALVSTMDLEKRRRLFKLLVRMGFREIEVGMPVSCRTDLEFVRWLATADVVPDEVTPQVLVPMRPELIEQTVASLRGLRRAVLQVFHPTSAVQRRVVFGASRAETRRLALHGAELAMRLRDAMPQTQLSLQYGPESFTQTEPDFALEVCNAVLERWQPQHGDDIRVNLPATVESFPPNEFADRIEWMHRNLAFRDRILLGVHPHNDRGSAVAATELALLAGADRVEGTLFGNGERSGNVCLVTLAMNLFSQGIDPMLQLGELDEIQRVTEECTGMRVPERHPWAGELVYTSLAGSHQDAIAKGLRAREDSASQLWEVPYLPVDPHDIGRDYRALIRCSDQSGKGGFAYVLRTDHGVDLPRGLQVELAQVVRDETDSPGHAGELDSATLWSVFQHHFLVSGAAAGTGWDEETPEALLSSLAGRLGLPARLLDLVETSTPKGHACFCELGADRLTRWGAGIEPDPASARRSAVYSGLCRLEAGLRT